ncbi:MAG: hypothetical protein EHM72_20495 [Calditrichaeota bacterium]|nr:MAG: hypothetical protein EHM72_20495 [Calditrichota bacterium]
MDSKLTLKLNKKTIEKAKSFAKKNNTSLSNLVENYFETLLQRGSGQRLNLPPTVKALAGVLQVKNNLEIDALKEQHLMEKYIHE